MESKMSIPATEEKGEQELAELIKQAGQSARELKEKTLTKHFARLRAIIAEALQQREKDAHDV